MLIEPIFAPEALEDMQGAYTWYEESRPGLGEEFLWSLEACLHGICRRPEMYEKVHQDFRRALLRRFPYAVFYEYFAGAVTVYCVFHTSQDPEKWRQRLT